jgi:tetratricopeptide (TPR) repeat protein
VACYERATRVNDGYLEAYAGLAVAYRQAGRPEEADEAVEMALRVAPGTTRLYQEISRVMMQTSLAEAVGRQLDVPAGAVAAAAEAIDPADVLGAELRAHAQAVTDHPDFPDYRYRYGLLLKSAGRIEDALEQFRAAVAINPTYVKALVKLGLTAWEAGRLEEAAATLSKAVNLQPQYVDLHYRLGLVYADRGLWPLAVEQYRKALDRQPDAASVEASLALALENMGLIGEDAVAPAAPPDGAAT